MGQARKKYTQEYKDEAVELVVSSDRPIVEIARDLGIVEGTLGNRVQTAKKPGKVKERPLSAGERAELDAAREEIHQNMREGLVIDALKMAIAGRCPKQGQVVFHSDRKNSSTGACGRTSRMSGAPCSDSSRSSATVSGSSASLATCIQQNTSLNLTKKG